MKNRKIVFLSALCVCILLLLSVSCLVARQRYDGPRPAGTLTQAPTGAGWVNLLDAVHRDDWLAAPDDKAIFEIADGTLHIFGKSKLTLRYIVYEGKKYSNFELHVEFKVSPGANSGVFLWARPEDPVQRGFEIQVLDDHGKAPNAHGSGAIYDVVTPMQNMAFPAGQWNAYDIRVMGSEVSVRMNGWLVVQADFDLMRTPIGKFDVPYRDLERTGFLMLQDHGGEVWYRNIHIRELPAEGTPEAP